MSQKTFTIVAAIFAVFCVAVTESFGAPAGAVAGQLIGGEGVGVLGKGIGLGLVIMGAGKGIGAIGSHTVDAIARQPEAAGPVGQNGLILAALIEGATLFAIVALSFLF